jgi:hypothetical protein
MKVDKVKFADSMAKAATSFAALAEKAFCPTGPGGGVNPTCGSGGGSGGGSGLSPEAAKERKALTKMMPSGSKATADGVRWEKRGGQAGKKILSKLVEKATAAGFVQQTHESHSSQAGPVGSGQVYKHPNGHTLRTDKSFGATADSNWYSATLTFGSGPA